MEYTKTKEEHDIALCVQNSTLIGNVKDPNVLLKVITEWRIYIGIPKAEDLGEELSVLTKFIYDNYGFLTVDEIRLAYNLSVTRKLKDVEFYGYFSPLYVGKVLDSYLYYRKVTMADVIREKEKAEREQKELENRPSPEKQAENMKALMRDFYDEYKAKGEIRDLFSIAYNFLRKHKLLIIPKEMIDEALAYGNKMAKDKNNSKPLFERFSPSTEETESQRYARNYCVQKFFDNVNIDIFLNNIKPELFN